MMSTRTMTAPITRMACRRDEAMAAFTDSPYEHMMQQKPVPGKTAGDCILYPPGHKCHGCPYGRGRPCVGVCMKKLYPGKRKK